MENLVENHGLSWIAVKILDQLDDKSLATARLIKSTWKDLIDETLSEKRKLIIRERRLVHEKLKKIKERCSNHMFKLYPEWKNIINDFQERRSSEDIEKLCELITKYCDYYIHISSSVDPLMLAVEFKNDISVLELVLPSVKSLRYTNREGCTVLHIATTYGRLEMVKLILNEYAHLIDIEQREMTERRTVIDEAMIQMVFRNTLERRQILSLYKDFEKNQRKLEQVRKSNTSKKLRKYCVTLLMFAMASISFTSFFT